MARGATIYRASLGISLVDRGVYAEPQLTVARHPSETLERVVVRLLAFGLRYAEGLEFGRGVSAADEPAVWLRDGDGRIREWVDVGQPDAKRLTRASRKADLCQVFVFGDRDRRWRAAQLETLKVPDNLGVACIDDAFIATLAGICDRQIEWSMTLAEGVLYLTSGDTALETTPDVWAGDPLG